MKKKTAFFVLLMSLVISSCKVVIDSDSLTPDSTTPTIEDSSSEDNSSPTSNSKPSSPNEEPSSPNEQPSSPNEQPSSPNEEPSSPNEQPSSPNEQPSSPNEQPSSPNEQPSSPNEQPSSPSEEPNYPLDDPSGEVTKNGVVDVIDSAGLYEGGYVTYSPVSNADSYNIYVKGGEYTSFTKVDTDIAYTRKLSSSKVRTDLFGLPKGKYEVKIIPATSGVESNATPTVVSISTIEYDRSGYAHFNYTEGVGAYNDDGSLKDNAIVIYVTEENKDSVMSTIPELQDYMFNIPTYFSNSWNGKQANGIGWWLNNAQYTKSEKDSSGNAIQSKSSNTYSPDGATLGFGSVCKTNPIVIRIVGTVTKPEGLTAYDSLNEGGTVGDNGAMARMKNLRNVTVEGVGEDARIEGWGIHFMNSDTTGQYGKNFEVRNLTFSKYPEDALGMEGVQEGNVITAPVQRCWIHHITFLPGYCANPAESDKSEGDGSCDFKRGMYYTMSYCYYEYCHKTNLIGSSDSSLQYNISFHHNVWYNCGSRIPLLRNANLHFYNNYIYCDINDKSAELSYVSSLRADCYMFAEANYYEGAKLVLQVKEGKAKMYNNEYLACFNTFDAVTSATVNSRTATVSNSCSYNGTNYQTFDTNPNLFYYDAENQVSDCYLTSATTARLENIATSGSYYRTILNETTLKTNAKSNLYDVSESIKFTGDTYTASLTSDTGILYTSVSKGKFKNQGITFRLSDSAVINVTMTGGSSAAANAGYVVSENGQIMLSGSGSAKLTPGLYYIVSCAFDKETTVSSLSFTKYNDENLNQALLDEYNSAVSAIPSTITYTDSTYQAIANAQSKYNSLPSSVKGSASYTEVQGAYDAYIQAGKTYVEGLISSIGTVDENSGSSISVARKEYDKLVSVDSNVSISNYSTLTAAESAFANYAVTSCINKINAIGNVTLASKNAIEAARDEYNQLSASQRESVTNYSVLLEAEDAYETLANVNDVNVLIENADLTSISSLEEVIEAYEALTSAEQALVTDQAKYSTIKVTCTMLLIDEIGTVTESSATAINKAKAMYDSLTSAEQQLVTNYSTLESAIEELNAIASAKVVHTFTYGSSSAYSYSDNVFTISGNTSNSKGNVTYNGVTYSDCLKLESGTKITVNCATEKTLILVVNSNDNVKLDGTKVSGTANAETSGSYIITLTLSAGSHTITKGDSANLYYMELK